MYTDTLHKHTGTTHYIYTYIYIYNCIYTTNRRLIVYTKNVLADHWPRTMAFYAGLFKMILCGIKCMKLNVT